MPAAGVKPVLAAIVKTLTCIKTFHALVEDIYTFPDRTPLARNLTEAIAAMPDPSAMVAFRGMTIGSRGSIGQFLLHFGIIVRLPIDVDTGGGSAYVDALHSLLSEPATNTGLRFVDSQIHPDFDPPEQISFLPALDANGTEYWQLNFSLMTVGG